jgi:hypothetical protein
MLKRYLPYIMLACFLFPKGLALAAAEKESAAIASALHWLRLIDEGSYTQSWADACRYFKGMVKPDQWEQAMKGARQPLGRYSQETSRVQSIKHL